MQPKVSVIIPTYNYASFIITAVEKILEQDYPTESIEIIVVDDGSIDNTKEILAPFIDQRKIVYQYQENQGKAAATYKAIKLATGKYVFNLDADDFYFPDKISSSVRIFESDENIVHVGSPAKIYKQDIDSIEAYEAIPMELADKLLDGNWLIKHFYTKNLLLGGGSTYGARASVLKKVEIPAAIDMYIDELLIIAILPYGKSYLISEALSIWRDHGTNYSGFASVSKEKKINKAKRLLDSCEAMYEYLRDNRFPEDIVNLGKLRYLNLQIAFKELTGTKTIGSIIFFLKEVFIKIHPAYSVIRAYSLINRLVPTFILKKLKKEG